MFGILTLWSQSELVFLKIHMGDWVGTGPGTGGLWTQSIAVGDKSFLKQIKDNLGFRAKGRKILETEDEYHSREGQAVYGDWRNSDTENKFNRKLAN